jgi:hypothetical protein
VDSACKRRWERERQRERERERQRERERARILMYGNGFLVKPIPNGYYYAHHACIMV